MKFIKNFTKKVLNNNFKNSIYKILINKDFILNSPGKKSFLFPINYINYYHNQIVPFKQIAAYDALKKFTSICEKLKVNLYAAHGTLLGAIRAESFAGRPKDLDFYISSSDMDKIIDNLDLFKVYNIKPFKCKIYKSSFQFKPARGATLDLEVFKFDGSKNEYVRDIFYFESKQKILESFKVIIYKERFDLRKIDKSSNKNVIQKTLKLENIEKRIFDQIIKVPTNYKQLLIDQYGKDWQIPKGKQNG